MTIIYSSPIRNKETGHNSQFQKGHLIKQSNTIKYHGVLLCFRLISLLMTALGVCCGDTYYDISMKYIQTRIRTTKEVESTMTLHSTKTLTQYLNRTIKKNVIYTITERDTIENVIIQTESYILKNALSTNQQITQTTTITETFYTASVIENHVTVTLKSTIPTFTTTTP
eukprot:GHVP01029364.1.p1 GENE.GHVP01029364.1~~GHVP01029364.1.p1  ORF type:complete len:170 (-),score=8.94 GHVP01029364.1:431-940(-)